MSKNDDLRILEYLANDQFSEMMPDELEDLLNAELAKPDTEIDGQLVDEILKVLEPSVPTEAQVKRSWPHILRALPHRRQHRRRFSFVHAAALMVIFAVVFLFTGQDAVAIPWTLIQKFLSPISETFSILINEQSTPSFDDSVVYSADDIQSTQINYTSLSDIPETHDGYTVRPQWLPDGFTFSSGSLFSGIGTTFYTMDFTSGDAWISFTIQFFDPKKTISYYDFEYSLELPETRHIGKYDISIYSNAHDQVQSISWIYENVYYFLAGKITQEDIVQFVEHLN